MPNVQSIRQKWDGMVSAVEDWGALIFVAASLAHHCAAAEYQKQLVFARNWCDADSLVDQLFIQSP